MNNTSIPTTVEELNKKLKNKSPLQIVRFICKYYDLREITKAKPELVITTEPLSIRFKNKSDELADRICIKFNQANNSVKKYGDTLVYTKRFKYNYNYTIRINVDYKTVKPKCFDFGRIIRQGNGIKFIFKDCWHDRDIKTIIGTTLEAYNDYQLGLNSNLITEELDLSEYKEV